MEWWRRPCDWNGTSKGSKGEGGHSPGVLRAQRADQGHLDDFGFMLSEAGSHCGDSNDTTYILNK